MEASVWSPIWRCPVRGSETQLSRMPEKSVPQGDFCTAFPVARNQENAIENSAREPLLLWVPHLACSPFCLHKTLCPRRCFPEKSPSQKEPVRCRWVGTKGRSQSQVSGHVQGLSHVLRLSREQHLPPGLGLWDSLFLCCSRSFP